MFKLSKRNFSKSNVFDKMKSSLSGSNSLFYDLNKLNDSRVKNLPFSIRILLENVMRNCDNYIISENDVSTVLDWQKNRNLMKEIPFKPSRVLLQDFTGVPAVVDLAAMRDAVKNLNKDPNLINPLCPVDLVIDHSVQVDKYGIQGAADLNEKIEFERNRERFAFLKWGSKSFKNFSIVPPGSGIVHQINLEYLARVVFDNNNLLYPDSVVGTDSHTTMINGLGVLGWGVGGIEAEAVMLGQHIGMILPEVVGFKLTGTMKEHVNATDLVLKIVNMLRKKGVVGKFVEFYGEGVDSLTLADRATISNMGPEYGATVGYFPIDNKSLEYLKLTGRKSDKVNMIQNYLNNNMLLRNYKESNNDDNMFSSILELNLDTVEPNLSGPKRPHDLVSLKNMKNDFNECLTNKVGFKGFGLSKEEVKKEANLNIGNKNYKLNHGALAIAAITSCTNTSNPGVMIQAGLLAKNAVEKGLNVKSFVKTSLSPGSGVVKKYFEKTDILKYLEKLGFHIAGYGCMTCIGNSGEIDENLSEVIKNSDLIASAVLSGNRNFEGRVHPQTRANYLASPPLVVAYALAGTVDFDFDSTPLGKDNNGKDIFLKDIWPSRKEVENLASKTLNKEMFENIYNTILEGNDSWKNLKTFEGETYEWDENSTYIHNPPFFSNLSLEKPQIKNIENAYCLLNLGDSITTDHISPAGNIAKDSAAADFLMNKNITSKDFNTYGARRGNDEIMARGTFANIRLVNKMVDKVGPYTIHIPTGEERKIFDASKEYQVNGQQTIILAGSEYGSGSSRDWAAKGPYLLGVKGVIAKSYERIHRSNLIGMGILPMQFIEGEDAEVLKLNGTEQYTINLKEGKLSPNEEINVKCSNGKQFKVKIRLDTKIEIDYFNNGGILHYVLRNMLK